MGNPSKVGMMGTCFFTGRSELLNWVNQTLGTSLNKVEQCSSGAVYCQLVDAAHGGGAVRMAKVNWSARAEPECIANFKILQSAFDNLKVERNVDVDKMVRGKYQDNLEMLQWVKHYYDSVTQNGQDRKPYDARARRNACQFNSSSRAHTTAFPAWANITFGEGEQLNSSTMSIEADAANHDPTMKRSYGPGSGGPSGVSGSNNNNAKLRSTRNTRTGGRIMQNSNNNSTGSLVQGGGPIGQQQGSSNSNTNNNLRSLSNEIEELRKTVDGLETERDYYFGKLREIEIMTQNLDPTEGGAPAAQSLSQYTTGQLVKEVQRILYKEE